MNPQAHAIPLIFFPLVLGFLVGILIGLGIGGYYLIVQLKQQLIILASTEKLIRKTTVLPRVLFAILTIVGVVLFFTFLFSNNTLLDSQTARIFFVLISVGFSLLITLLCVGISLTSVKVKRKE